MTGCGGLISIDGGFHETFLRRKEAGCPVIQRNVKPLKGLTWKRDGNDCH